MSLNRRRFLAASSLAAAALATRAWPRDFVPLRDAPRIALDPDTLAKFVDPLPRLESAPGGPHFRIAMREVRNSLHRDLPPTRQWSYGASVPGPLIETRSGQAVSVEWVNALPARHFLPIDHTLHGAEPTVPEVRAVVHVHGAKVPSASDGYPDQWFVPGQSRVCHYPNQQPAALLWYHDHTMGINRLNIYAGLFGLFVVRDAAEDALPLPRGAFDIPLVIYDRMLDRQGQLLYPVSDDPKAPWIPEFFGNALMLNGKLWPHIEVEPRPYRFRILNSSNGRFLTLSLSSGDALRQIGSDQGLLPAPVAMRNLTLAPAERADLVIDFSRLAGQQLFLKNDVTAVLRFQVAARPALRGRAPDPPAAALPAVLQSVPRIPESAAVRSRSIVLTEYDDAAGRSILMLLGEKYWHDPVSEKPLLDSTEIWSFINTTDDSHPIHLHLVRFQILDRRNFDADQYLLDKTLRYTNPSVPPDPNEWGWKDTVKAHGGMVTRIIIPFHGYAGRYLYHCHILEHEAKDMMRPFEVVSVE